MRRTLSITAVAFILCIATVNTTKGQFSGGDGSVGSPYIITTAAQLAQLATLVSAADTAYNDKYYKLANNIDLSAYGAGFNNGKGWIPIGKYSPISAINAPFKGFFDGDSNIITGLYINDSTLDGAGLFGSTYSANIQNLILDNVNIRGGSSVGGLTGNEFNDSYFINCGSSGSIRGENGLGGLVGQIRINTISSTSFSRCYSSCNVSGNGHFVGGIVGETGQNCSLMHCYSTGNVSGQDYVGGIVGMFLRFITLRYCYSTGNITGNNYVGGIAGYIFSSSLWQGYSTGSITGNQYVGGIVGEVDKDCCMTTTIRDFFALNSSIKGNSHVGRIMGLDANDLPTLDNAAYDSLLNNAGTVLWLNKGANQIDGEDISKDSIHADGSLGGKFVSSYGWTTQNGKLPGLFGKPVDMPPHLQKGGSGGTSIAEQNNSDIRVYPNPAQNTLYIQSAETVEQVSIYDISGRMLLQTTRQSIDISHLANGIYIIKVKTATGETLKRIVVSD